MTSRQHEVQKLVAAARTAALALDKGSPGRQAIFNLAHEFEDLARDHDLCILRREKPIVAVAPGACQCTNHMPGFALCYHHAVERTHYLNHKMGTLFIQANDMKPECRTLEDATARYRATVTVIPPTGSVSDKKPTAREINKAKAASILEQINKSVGR